jgi:hypothetical protein
MFTQYDLIQDSKLNNKAMPVSNVYTFDGPGTISGKKYIDLQYTPDNPKNIQIQILHGTSLVNCEINNLLGEFRLIEDDNGDLKRISWNSPADVPSAFVQTMLDTGDSIFVTYNTKNLVLPEPVMPPAPVFGSLYNSVSEAQADGWKRYFNFNNPFVIVDGNGDVQNVYDVLDETKYLRRYSQVSTNKPKRDEIGKFEHSVYMNGSYGTMYEPVASFSQLGTKIVVSCWVKTLSAKQYSSSTDLGIVSFRCYSGYTKNDVMLYDTFSLCINSSKKKIQVGFRDQVNEDTGYPHQIYKDISNLGFWDANMYGTDIWHNIFIEIPLSVDFQFSSINF